MRSAGFSVLLLATVAGMSAACATTPNVPDSAVYPGSTVDEVREAARVVVEEVAHPESVVRVTDDRVMTEGRFGVCGKHVACGGTADGSVRFGNPWTTLKVGLRDRGSDTAIELDIDYETRRHCSRSDPSCSPARLGSTGVLEQEIIDGIRARLEDGRSGAIEPEPSRRPD